jgi:ABC-type oligopeptide transport system ATPase subunit
MISSDRDLRESSSFAGWLFCWLQSRPAEKYLGKYPHELSGGERQRVASARAIVVGPQFIVADEPVSMLDVSVRAGILNVLRGLQADLQMTYLFITHDLAVARYMCDRIAIMYFGHIVEVGPTETVLQNPQHLYTQYLISSVPEPDPSLVRPEPPTLTREKLLPSRAGKTPPLHEISPGHFVLMPE